MNQRNTRWTTSPLQKSYWSLLNPKKLKFEGREKDVPEELRQKAHFIANLDLAIEHYNSYHGIEVFMDVVGHLDGQAMGVIGRNENLKEAEAQITTHCSSFSWGKLPIDDDTDAMLNIGDNTYGILGAVMHYHLAFGKSSELLERCVQLLEHGFLPFGYDEEKNLILAYSRPVN